MSKKKPQSWQDVDWNRFKQSVKVGRKNYTPKEFLDMFYDEYGDCILSAELEETVMQTLNWGYLNGKGKWFSMGLFYHIPKCCIYDFAFGKLKNRHKLSNAYTNYMRQNGGDDSWILCNVCAEYVEKHGLEAYLKNKTWEQE